MKQPIISIIIPVYNVENYLEKCIDSILSQSFKYWEIILIDDGSKDNSGFICDSYADKYENIKVYHIKNQGVSIARDYGVKKAKGEWITFIDSDDWIQPDYLNSLYNPIIENSKLDFVQGGCLDYKEGEGFSVNQQYENYIGNDHLLLFNIFRGIISSKLYRKDIIEKYQVIHDTNLKIAEDWLFTLDYIIHVDYYCFIDSTDYIYRRRSSSATTSKREIEIDKNINGFIHRYDSFLAYQLKFSLKRTDLSSRWKEMSNVFCQEIVAHMFKCNKNQLKKIGKISNYNLLFKYQKSFKKQFALSLLFIIIFLFRCERILQPKLRWYEFKTILKMLLSWIVSKIIRKEKDLWLFCERGKDARDNGFWMFRYIMQNHPEINAKYIISDESEDKKNLNQWSDRLVKNESFKHYILMWQGKYFCSTHVYGCFPFYINQILLLSKVVVKLLPNSRNIWLQHGVTIHDMPNYHYEKTPLDMIVSGAKPESEYLIETFGFSSDVIKYTGLARFDGLHNFNINKNQILLMPTWRKWLNKSNIKDSDYFRTYSNLLINRELHSLLDKKGLRLIFYPHYEIQPYIEYFRELHLPSSILIADKNNYDVQQLLKDSSLLITDHSSVFIDFAYMKKYVIFFQFDDELYYKGHYRRGYFDFRNEFGDRTDNSEDLINSIKRYYNQDCRIDDIQIEKINNFFTLHDNYNCERIFNNIINLR